MEFVSSYKAQFEKIHLAIELSKDSIYKGIQLYFSPVSQSEILFIGINPGSGYFNYNDRIVKRLSPLKSFEYNKQKYMLAAQTKQMFKEIGMSSFSNSVKINHFPFATENEKDLYKLLNRYDKIHKIYYLSKQYVCESIDFVNPKLIICEGKSSFDRLKIMWNVDPIEYNADTFVMKKGEMVAIGYRRIMSHIKAKKEVQAKIKQYHLKS